MTSHTRDARQSRPAAGGRPARRSAPAARLASGAAESEEVLVADPRGLLTPAQMVDRKLLLLLGGGSPGLVIQAAGRPGDVRRTAGG